MKIIYIRTSSAIFCRICYSNESKEHLTNWCNCSGTMGLMHKSCLERWLSQSNSNNCEICKYEFKVEKVPRSFKQVIKRLNLGTLIYHHCYPYILVAMSTNFVPRKQEPAQRSSLLSNIDPARLYQHMVLRFVRLEIPRNREPLGSERSRCSY